jgi:hypothetical protein
VQVCFSAMTHTFADIESNEDQDENCNSAMAEFVASRVST